MVAPDLQALAWLPVETVCLSAAAHAGYLDLCEAIAHRVARLSEAPEIGEEMVTETEDGSLLIGASIEGRIRPIYRIPAGEWRWAPSVGES